MTFLLQFLSHSHCIFDIDFTPMQFTETLLAEDIFQTFGRFTPSICYSWLMQFCVCGLSLLINVARVARVVYHCGRSGGHMLMCHCLGSPWSWADKQHIMCHRMPCTIRDIGTHIWHHKWRDTTCQDFTGRQHTQTKTHLFVTTTLRHIILTL